MSPAGTAVLGNVLVLIPGEVVLTIHEAPINVGGKHINGEEAVTNNFFTIFEGRLLNTAVFRVFFERFLTSVFRLGHGVDSLVIVGVILLFLSSNVFGSPILRWNSPSAFLFDSKVVHTSNDSEETLLTPMRAPGVSNSPVLHSVLFAPTND